MKKYYKYDYQLYKVDYENRLIDSYYINYDGIDHNIDYPDEDESIDHMIRWYFGESINELTEISEEQYNYYKEKFEEFIKIQKEFNNKLNKFSKEFKYGCD